MEKAHFNDPGFDGCTAWGEGQECCVEKPWFKALLKRERGEAYTRGRVDEAKTCKGCKEDNDKVREKAIEEVIEELRKVISEIKDGEHALRKRVLYTGLIAFFRTKFLKPKDDD